MNEICRISVLGIPYELLDILIPIGIPCIWFTDTVPNDHWHFADGSSFDPLEYPKLHEVYPDDKFPDVRELTLTGAGENDIFLQNLEDPTAEYIHAHDIFEIGEFKDDQFQGHEHRYQLATGYADGSRGSDYQRFNDSQTTRTTEIPYTKTGYSDVRYGTVTRGKRMGCNYIIRVY